MVREVSCDVLVVFLPDMSFEHVILSGIVSFCFVCIFSTYVLDFEVVSNRVISAYSLRKEVRFVRTSQSKAWRPRLSLFHFMYKGIARCRDQRN